MGKIHRMDCPNARYINSLHVVVPSTRMFRSIDQTTSEVGLEHGALKGCVTLPMLTFQEAAWSVQGWRADYCPSMLSIIRNEHREHSWYNGFNAKQKRGQPRRHNRYINSSVEE